MTQLHNLTCVHFDISFLVNNQMLQNLFFRLCFLISVSVEHKLVNDKDKICESLGIGTSLFISNLLTMINNFSLEVNSQPPSHINKDIIDVLMYDRLDTSTEAFNRVHLKSSDGATLCCRLLVYYLFQNRFKCMKQILNKTRGVIP